MAEIRPFKALRYGPQNADLLLAPPYDVIPPDLHRELLARHPHNVVRLILNPEPDRGPREDWYDDAAGLLQQWRDQGILVQDGEPALYLYSQRYTTEDGRVLERKGFFCLLKLEGYEKGVVAPHERTMKGPKADRLRLWNRCNANLSPVFIITKDPEEGLGAVMDRAMAKEKPFLEAHTPDGQSHALWRLTDPQAVKAMGAAMRDKQMVIADGHHRFETAIELRALRLQGRPEAEGEQAEDYTLVYIVRAEDPGLIVLPTHRILEGPAPMEPERLKDELSREFTVEEVWIRDAEEADLPQRYPQATFMVILGGRPSDRGRQAFVLTSRQAPPTDRPKMAAELDVAVLHSRILGPVLGIERAEELLYERSMEKIFHLLDTKAWAAFLVRPTPVDEVLTVAGAGERLPQKTTYFFPKVPTGLVLRLIG